MLYYGMLCCVVSHLILCPLMLSRLNCCLVGYVLPCLSYAVHPVLCCHVILHFPLFFPLSDAAVIISCIDNQQVSKIPDKWHLHQLLTTSVILAICLTVSSLAHYFIGKEVFGLTKRELQTVVGIAWHHITSSCHVHIHHT